MSVPCQARGSTTTSPCAGISQTASCCFETVAQNLGLHAADLKALNLLGERAMTAGHLAEATGLTGAAVTALVDRLEASGYVTRERDADDRRRVTIRAVPAKFRKIAPLYESLRTEAAKLVGKYSAAELAAIGDFMTNVAQILAEQRRRTREK